jgi:hypothetical protein
VVRFVGAFDDTFARQDFAPLATERVLLFDMEEVRKVTSFGVREWLEGLKSLRAEYYGFARCRPAVVAQFNMVSGFLGRGQVLSLYAPYTCPECNQELEQLLDLRSQFPNLAARKIPPLRCSSCGVDAIFDDLPDSYFSFLLAPPSPPPLALALLSSLAGGTVQKNTIREVTHTGWEAKSGESDITGKIAALPQRFDSQLGRSARVLLIDPEPAIGKGISRTLRTLANTIDTLKETPGDLSSYDVVIAQLQPDLSNLSALTAANPRPGRLIVYSSQPVARSFVELLRTTVSTHFLWAKRGLDGEELYVTVYKMLSGEFFSVDKYFSWGARNTQRIPKSQAEALAAAQGFADEFGLAPTLSAQVTQLAGALYECASAEPCRISLFCDGRRFGVELSTPNSDALRVLDALSRMPPTPILSHIITNAKPGANTEYIGLLDLRAKEPLSGPSYSFFGELPSPNPRPETAAPLAVPAPAAPPMPVPAAVAPAPSVPKAQALAVPTRIAQSTLAPPPVRSAPAAPPSVVPAAPIARPLHPVVVLLIGLLLGGGMVSLILWFLRS